MRVYGIRKLSDMPIRIPDNAKYVLIVDGKATKYVAFTDMPMNVADARIESELNKLADIKQDLTPEFAPKLEGKKFPSDGAKLPLGAPIGYGHGPRITASPFREDEDPEINRIAEDMLMSPEDMVNESE